VWVNLGSIQLARGKPAEAVTMYEKALAHFYNNKDAKVLLWLARALYDQKLIPQSKRALLKAVHICPHDHSLLFNTAVTLQGAADVCARFEPASLLVGVKFL
jgi:tetratricopeptide (TPR) repeat protein